MIEKEGLDYEIKIIDSFSVANAKFKAQLQESKDAFADFKTTLASAGTASQGLRDTQREIAAALKASGASLKTYNQAISDSVILNKAFVRASGNRATALRDERSLLASVNRLNQFRLTQQTKTIALDTQNAGIRQQLATATKELNDQIKQIIRINRTESATIRQKVGLLRQELSLKRQLAKVPTGRQGGGGGGGGSGQQRQASALNKTLQDTDSTSNRLLFTFRRLFGVLAAFTIARVAVGGFRDLIKSGIAFNSKIEDTTLGIASLITALSDVSDATGQSVDSVGKLALAEREATRQVGLLRKEALTTAATFDQLLETFQVALAPGFTAGLGIDQIRKLTVQISQAATAIALPQNQLAEEIRSLLSGTIQARTTRIATALGISNEDIRKAKELGTLFEFLTDRFKTFTIAGVKAQKNLSVALTNVKDGLIQIIAEGFQGGSGGTLGLFEELKSLILDIDESIKSTGQDDIIRLNPNLVALVRRVADGLKESVIQAKLLIQNLSFEQALSIATTLGQVLKTGAQAAGVLVEGVVKGLKTIGDVVVIIRDVFSNLSSLLPEGSLRRVAVSLVQIATIAVALNAVLSVILSKFGKLILRITAINGLWKGFLSLIGQANTGFGRVTTVLAGILSIMPLLSKPFQAISSTVIAIVAGILGMELAVRKTVKAVTGLDLNFSTILTVTLNNTIKTLEKAKVEAELIIARTERKLQNLSGLKKRSLDEEIEKLERRHAVLESQQGLQEEAIIAADKLGFNLEDLPEKALELISGKTGKLTDDLNASSNAAKSFGQIISELPPIITEATDRLEGQVDNVKELREEILKAKDDLRFVQESLGLENTVLDQARTIFEGQVEAREATKKLTEKQISFEQRLLRATLDREAAERRFNLLLNDEKLKVNDLISLANDLALSNEVAQKLETQLILTKQELQRAGTIEEKKALQEKLDFIKSALATEKLATAENLKQADALAEGVDAGKLVELKDIFNALITNRTLEAVLEEKIKTIQEQRLKTESEINEKVSARITEQALKGTIDTKKEIDDLVSKLKLQEATNAAVREGVQERLEAGAAGVIKAEIENLKEVLRLENERLENQKELIQEQLAVIETPAGPQTDEAIALQNQLTALSRKQFLNEQNINAEIDERNAKLALTNELLTATPFEVVTIGIREAFDGLKKETENVFGFIKDLTERTVNSAADLLSGVIVDALDPSKDVNIKERLGKFLQDIGQQIFAFLTKIAIVKTALGVTSLLGGAGAAEGGTISLAEGGKIPKRGKPSRAHYRKPVGHARGHGIARPRGLDRRDTVPIWAQPGEFMVKLERVRQVGEAWMNDFNEGRINPFALKALQSSTANSPILRRPKTGSYAKGGGVSAAPQLSRSRQESGLALAVSIGSEREANRVLAQGRRGMLSFIEENRTTIKSMLDRK